MAKRKKAEDEREQQPSKRSKQSTLTPSGTITTKPTQPEVQTFTVSSHTKGKDIPCERRGSNGKPSLIFTHGAGGGLSAAATKNFAEGFAQINPVVAFEGTMNLPSRVRNFQSVLTHEKAEKVGLGGRSMGARAAVLCAQAPENADEIKALVLVSYPMVGAQKGDSREQILLDLPEGIDVLFISGSKDSMCSVAHLRRVMDQMKGRTWVVEVQGADHGMNLRPKAGTEVMVRRTGEVAAEWIRERDDGERYCSLSWSKVEGKVVTEGWVEEPVQET